MKNDRKALSALLRTTAEAKLKKVPAGKDAQSAKPSNLAFIHELEVHQIELQMQNEALQVSKAASEAARIKYAELYDFAFVIC